MEKYYIKKYTINNLLYEVVSCSLSEVFLLLYMNFKLRPIINGHTALKQYCNTASLWLFGYGEKKMKNNYKILRDLI